MNRGIMHLASTRGGKPFCGHRGAHMSTTREHQGGWLRICKKCEAVEARYAAIRAKREINQGPCGGPPTKENRE